MIKLQVMALFAGAGLLVGGAFLPIPRIDEGHRSSASRLKALISNYQGWRKVNTKPILMKPALAALCVGAPKWNLGNNPHDPRYFTVYVNDEGRSKIGLKGSSTKVGTVIVKQKLPSAAGKPELLTVMVKREAGFDPQNGDWQYFTANGSASEVSQNGIDKCQSCHSMAKDKDYVFPIAGS